MTQQSSQPIMLETARHRIFGKIQHREAVRLSDHLKRSEGFLSVYDAQVEYCDGSGAAFATEFIAVRLESIVFVLEMGDRTSIPAPAPKQA